MGFVCVCVRVCANCDGVIMHRYNFVDDSDMAYDCDGHGTHVASTAAGRMVGVAKAAQVVAVKVLDCQVQPLKFSHSLTRPRHPQHLVFTPYF
jgi:hypothetical protein